MASRMSKFVIASDRDAEQLRGVLAEDHALCVSRKPGLFDERDRVVLSDRIVGAEHDLRRSYLVDQELEDVWVVNHGVVEEPAQVLARLLLDVRRLVWAVAKVTIDAPRVVRQESAAVRDAELELRKAIQGAFVHQRRHGDRFLDRLPDAVPHQVLREAWVLESRRMDENGNAQALRLGPEWPD